MAWKESPPDSSRSNLFGPPPPPRFALAVVPPLSVLYPPYLFVTPLPTRFAPQCRPIDHRSSPTAFPPDAPLPPRHSVFPVRVFRDISLAIRRS
ncbi:hypothetical protein B0H16DRAFT_1745275 [Mycena metata]|uniref:Uncharacterized protein n=1 Tax=Mycena metata TaxID=1033252 RepID=A0AAD7MCY8_9AGAR|nr:hypothetical protein B0H16DRAFT_1745275 [Mycena metata]